MKTILILTLSLLAVPASADEGYYIYVTNKAGVVKKFFPPPPPPTPVVVNRNPLNRATFPPVPVVKTNSAVKIIVSPPHQMIFGRSIYLQEIESGLDKHPGDETLLRRKADMLRKFDVALEESFRVYLTNDLARLKYRCAVEFWRTNYMQDGTIKSGTPPESRRYVSPEVPLHAPTQ